MRCCCAAPDAPRTDGRPRRWGRRIGGIGLGAVPVVILALIPKCPACLAGYVLLFTGIGMSYSDASALRTGLIAASIAGLIWVAWRIARRVWVRVV